MVELGEFSVVIEVPEDLGDEEAHRLVTVLRDRLTIWSAETQGSLGSDGYDLRLRVEM